MHIERILDRDATMFSFEFFPPGSDQGWKSLKDRLHRFESMSPSFVSVTYGAGGNTRDRTHELVLHLATDTSLDPIPHLTCVGHDAGEIDEILSAYTGAGIDNILALRGDAPLSGATAKGDFDHAIDLVRQIRNFEGHSFGIGAAGFPEGHPDTPNRLLHMEHLKAKVDAGVDWLCTQLFFDNAAFYDWSEQCELVGINVPLIPGIMPITSMAGMRRMAELAAGCNIPAKLQKRLQRFQDDDASVRQVGIQWATEQCADLLDNGARGLHFYTLNRSEATEEIWKALGAPSGERLRSSGQS